MKNKFNRNKDETDQDYLLRICEYCDNKEITWNCATDILNKEFGTNFSESKYRKNYHSWKLGYEYALSKIQNNCSNNLIDKIKLEKIKIRDERLELNKLYRDIARSENVLKIIKDNVVPIYRNYSFDFKVSESNYSSDLIVCLSDLHIGSFIRSNINSYDEKILKNRIELYLNKIHNIYSLHSSRDIYLVILGDTINGHIHLNTRLSNNESTIKQIIIASEVLSSFSEKLSSFCNNLKIYYVNGNHGRIFPCKEDNTNNDNLESIIEYYLNQKLSNIKNIEVIINKSDSSFGLFKVRNTNVAYVHGDKDDPKTVVQKLTSFTKIPIDIVLMGHRHKNGMLSEFGSKVIESGCMCGPDEYAVNLRLSEPPQQAVAVINDYGLDCVYDVKMAQNYKATI